MAGIPPIASVTRDHRIGSFWRRLTDPERVALVGVARVRRYDRGASLIRVADTDRWVAVLHSGRVRVLAADQTRSIAMRWAGDIVGEQALLDHGTRSATVLAETPVRAIVVGGQEFDRVLDRHPRILRVLCAVVSERLREADRNLSGQTDDAFTKVAEILVRYVDEFGSADEPNIRVGIGSQAGLGDTLGLSRESIVRALKRLRELDIVTTFRGVVTVHDLNALREIAVR